MFLKEHVDGMDATVADKVEALKKKKDALGIKLSQDKYARDLLERFQMTYCKSAPTHFLSGVKLEDTPLVESTLYKQLVGILLYLTHSKPDLSYVLGTISRFMQELHELYWKAAKHILRYVHGTITFGIHYAAKSTLDLIRLTDFGQDANSTNKNSTSGYSLSLGSGPIYWMSKKQVAIYLFATEAEYRVVVNITIHAMWLQNFLTELGIQFHLSIVIWCDNQSTLNLYKDLVQRQRTKHIEIHMHYIEELVHEGIIDLEFCPLVEQS